MLVFQRKIVPLTSILSGGYNLQVPRNVHATKILTAQWVDMVNLVVDASLHSQGFGDIVHLLNLSLMDKG